MWKLISRVWKDGGIPEDCNKSVISPIYKKGEKSYMGKLQRDFANGHGI